MQQECLCLHCTASTAEAEQYFALFCEHDVEERRPIGAAPTAHLGIAIGQQRAEDIQHSECEEVS